MTHLQKAIVLSLLDGCNIANSCRNGFRLRTPQSAVIAKFYSPTFDSLKPLLRKEKNGLYVLDKRHVRSLHGQAWVKKEYKKKLKSNQK